MNIELIEKLQKSGLIEVGETLQDMINARHDEISDYCHEHADSCEDVIYYGRAEELYNKAATDERDQAESMVEDCGGFGEGATMASRFCLLAYWIVWQRTYDAITEELEELGESLADLASGIESAID